MENSYIRAHIALDRNKDIMEFVEILNGDGTCNHYTLENYDRSIKINARSIMGVMYFVSDSNEMYLVNETDDGKFPSGITKFYI